MSTESSIPDHLIQTKLYPPRVAERLISRQHLIDRLNRDRKRPLTLISAPAGYGKSTLAHQWLQAGQHPFAWLSLDKHDRGLDAILEYLIVALMLVIPEFGQQTNSLLKQPQLPKPERLADSVVRDLRALSQTVFLAIDDYHTVVNKDVHSFMTRLIQRLPADLHLVLITRADPPLSLAGMRGRQEVQEIRAADLRFTPKEAAELLEQIVGKPVTSATAELLSDRTEGWVVGLRMAAMSLRESQDPETFVRRYSRGGQRMVSDYLLTEVLEQLPVDRRALLVMTSTVDRFGASLVDALAQKSPVEHVGQDFVDLLWASNFFLMALDDQGVWFRYHHLFRELLQQRLAKEFSAQEIASLHIRAADWFEQAGMIEDAIVHYVKGGAGDGAARLVERNAHDVLNQEEWRMLDRWIHLLPDECLDRPALLAVQAVLRQMQMRFKSIASLLDTAEKRLDSGEYDYSPEETRSWKGVIELCRGIYLDVSNTSQDTLKQSERGLQNIEMSARYIRGVAENWQIVALHQSGRSAEAIEMAQHKLGQNIGSPDVRTHRLLLALGAVYYDLADVLNLHNLGNTYRDVALRTDHQVSLGWANFMLGWSSYQGNRLDQAEKHFSEIAIKRYLVSVRCAVDGITGLALSHAANERPDEVRQTLEMLRDFLVDQDAYMILPLVSSLELRLDQNRASWSSAPEWMSGYMDSLASDTWEQPALSACRVALAQGDAVTLYKVKRTLAGCLTFALSRNNRRHLMRIGALETLLHDARGKQEQALATLQTVVLLGESGGALRIFVDIGPQLIPLLKELHNRGIAVDYIERMLGVYGEIAELEAAPANGQSAVKQRLTPEAAVVMADLTNREMDVLQLLAQRLTNKEIASELYISPHTVKKYTLVLYQKLDVDGGRPRPRVGHYQ